MAWDEPFGAAPVGGGHEEQVELVGTNLRMTGTLSLGRFTRLTDLINASSGYLRIHDAQLLLRTGEPTDLRLPELMVDQDEVSFIAQRQAAAPEPGSGTGFIEPSFGDAPGIEARQAREFILFTPAHTVSGKVYIFGQTNLAAFVDSSDPRFVPVVDATTRSLTDRRLMTHYDFVLINRTQMIAAAEIGRQGDIAPEDLPEL